MTSRATPAMRQSESARLHAMLSRWEHRHKRRVLSKTLPRTLIGALLISLIFGVVAYVQLRWQPRDFVLASLAICGGGMLVNLLYTALFTRSRQAQARYFDLEFSLKERVSTALELLEDDIQTQPEIKAAQIADALTQASQIDPQDKIRLDFRRNEWLGMLVLLAALLMMAALPLLVGTELLPAGPSPAVQAAQEDVRDIIETIATDADLQDVDREALLNALQIALERLQEQDISDEEAFAAMSQLESQIEETENALQDTIDLDQSTLGAAAAALENFVPLTESAEMTDAGQEAAQRNLPDELAQALSQLAQMAQTMSPAEEQAAAEALQQAAQELAQMNPELSEQLENMAQALQRDDSQSLQEQLEQAQQELTQEQRASQQMQNARQVLQSQSEQAQQAADEIARQQSQQQEAAAPQQGDAETSANNRRQGQPGGDSADSVRLGDGQGNQPALQNMPGTGENRENAQNGNTAGQGAGEGQPSNTSLPGSGGEDQGAQTDNRASGTGELDYAAIYSPTGIDGGGANDIELRTDASDQTLAEGNFDDNPLGESRVSYDTVFSDYQQAANRALESDYVPLGLRDVVRDYFTSLEPNRS